VKKQRTSATFSKGEEDGKTEKDLQRKLQEEGRD